MTSLPGLVEILELAPPGLARRFLIPPAAEAVRHILVENIHLKKYPSSSGRGAPLNVNADYFTTPMPDDELLALDQALNRLAEVDAGAAELLKLCVFLGLTTEQAAERLEISLSTAEYTWVFASAWLFQEIQLSRTRSQPNQSAEVEQRRAPGPARAEVGPYTKLFLQT